MSKPESYTQSKPVNLIMKEALAQPMLTRSEEKRLCFLWFNNRDKEARNKVVSAYTQLAVKMASARSRTADDLTDLTGVALMALFESMNSFDPNKGAFTPHARIRIKSRLTKYKRNQYSIVQIASTEKMKSIFANLQKAKNKLGISDVHGNISPEMLEKLSKMFDTTPQEIAYMDSRMRGDTSASGTAEDVMENGSKTELESFFIAPNEDTEANYAEKEEREQKLSIVDRAKKVLTKRERAIFEGRHEAVPAVSWKVLAKKHKCTRQWAMEIGKKAFKKVKARCLEIQAEEDNE